MAFYSAGLFSLRVLAADIGKLVLLSPTTEANAYGILLDPAIDTAAAYSDGSVTGSIAKAGSFKGSALIVPTGVDAGLISVSPRGRGIVVEGPITVPATWKRKKNLRLRKHEAKCQRYHKGSLLQSVRRNSG